MGLHVSRTSGKPIRRSCLEPEPATGMAGRDAQGALGTAGVLAWRLKAFPPLILLFFIISYFSLFSISSRFLMILSCTSCSFLFSSCFSFSRSLLIFSCVSCSFLFSSCFSFSISFSVSSSFLAFFLSALFFSSNYVKYVLLLTLKHLNYLQCIAFLGHFLDLWKKGHKVHVRFCSREGQDNGRTVLVVGSSGTKKLNGKK